MALGYLLNPALQIEDNDGKPLTGGWLTVYQHGTTIPYITYKDFSGDRNPANIPLDAKGMAVVLASDGFSYDVYCYDRNAVQQWSRLNVTTSVVGVDGLYTFTSSDGTVGITTTTTPNEPTEIDLSAQQLTAGPNIDIINGVVSTEKPVVNAGTNVTITSSGDPSTRTITYNVSAVDTTYSAGSGLNLNGNTFSVDTSTVQPKLTAGNNIYFEGNTINAVDTLPVAGYGLSQSAYNILAVDTSVIQPKLTAGTNIQISNNVISSTNTTYTAGSGLALNGTEFSNTAPNVQSDWNAVAGSASEILNKPTIPTVNDGTLTIQKNGVQVATFSANQSSGATANITVPTDTSDLTNGAGFITASQVPAQVNADWNSSSGASEILNKPTIPTVNDGTLTIQKNGVQVATFSANQSSAATANITVPTDTSDLTNGAGFITSAQVPSQVNADWNSSSGASEILNKPTIPTVNDGTLTIQRNGTQVATFSANQSGNATANISVPTDTGDLTNGAGFITASQIPSTDDIVLVSTTSNTPYYDVSAAFVDGKTPVLYYGYQNSLQYYWFISKTASSYTFAAVNKGNYGNVVTEYVVNSDNTITSGSQTSAKRFSVNDETLTLDNGELKWRYPYSTYFGSVASRGGSVNWTNDMTSSHFNRKLVDMPLPAAGMYMVMYNGIGRFVDTGSDEGSPGMLFRVCIGDKTQSFSTIAGQWEFDDSSSNSKYTGFSGFTIVNMPGNYIADASLNISNNDYAPMSGVTQYFHWSELRVAWFRLPQ